MKVWLGAALGVFFCVGYFTLQRHPFRPPATLPLTAIDRAVPFVPGWAWVYQSVYLLMPTGWLATRRAELWRYAAGFVGIALVGFACFTVYPTAAPRPAMVPDSGMYGLLVSYDGVVNAWPSLHVALATYHALLVGRLVGGGWWTPLLAAWVGLIAFSTLATKQHYVVDLPPGLLLGWLGDRLAWMGDDA
jgi:hypothetical protein